MEGKFFHSGALEYRFDPVLYGDGKSIITSED
jgi:hypothetical protein